MYYNKLINKNIYFRKYIFPEKEIDFNINYINKLVRHKKCKV